jgi:two-component system, NarL family, nitrate/nitrite response regulator NarL
MDADSSASKPISLLIAVSVRLYRDGLSTLLSAHSGFSIAGTAASAPDALTIARARQPDAAIVDVSFCESMELIRALRVESASTCIIAFAVREDITTILEYAEAGADGFVTPQSSISELAETVKRTVAGELLCTPRLAAQLLRRAAHRRESSADDVPWPGLTIREGQVFGLIRQGLSNKEIASALNISEATVKNHVHHVLEKLQVSTRGQAAAGVRRVAKASLPQTSSTRRTS